MLTVDKSNNFDWKNIPLLDCVEGNSLDSLFTFIIGAELYPKVMDTDYAGVLNNIIIPIINIFESMEYNGLDIDPSRLEHVDWQLTTKIAQLKEELDLTCGRGDINYNSSQQLCKVLFSLDKSEDGDWMFDESSGFGIFPPSLTGKGQPATNEENVKKIFELVKAEYTKRGYNLEEDDE